MINYQKLRSDLKAFDVGYKSFQRYVDLAVAIQADKYIPDYSHPMLIRAHQKEDALESAEMDIKAMNWDNIKELASQAETALEMGYDKKKEEQLEKAIQSGRF